MTKEELSAEIHRLKSLRARPGLSPYRQAGIQRKINELNKLKKDLH